MCVWRLTQKTPPLMGFDVWAEPPMETPVGVGRIDMSAPAGLPLHWAARGGFEVTDQTIAGQRRIAAVIRGTQAAEPEREMVDAADFQPLFLATSLSRLQDVGAIYWRQSHDKAVVTPEISALAARIAGGRTGEDAARAIYDWVTANIRYVAVYLDPNDGWVPHPAQTVLEHGYGDCKDHVVLMQALLASLGIRAEAAMVDWGDRTSRGAALGAAVQSRHRLSARVPPLPEPDQSICALWQPGRASGRQAGGAGHAARGPSATRRRASPGRTSTVRTAI